MLQLPSEPGIRSNFKFWIFFFFLTLLLLRLLLRLRLLLSSTRVRELRSRRTRLWVLEGVWRASRSAARSLSCSKASLATASSVPTLRASRSCRRLGLSRAPCVLPFDRTNSRRTVSFCVRCLGVVLVLVALTAFLKPEHAKLVFEPATTASDRAKLRLPMKINVRKLRYWKRRFGKAKQRNLIRERQLAAHVAGLKAVRGRPLADLVLNELAARGSSNWRGFVANSADPHLYDYASPIAQVRRSSFFLLQQLTLASLAGCVCKRP